MSGTDISQYASTSSEPEESLDYLSDEETRKLEKCPICLVSPFTYVMTLCSHKFCLRCMLKMWESENSESKSFSLLFFFCPIFRRGRRVGSLPLSNLPRSRDTSELDFNRRADSSRTPELQLALSQRFGLLSTNCPVKTTLDRQFSRLLARFHPTDAFSLDTVYAKKHRSFEKL